MKIWTCKIWYFYRTSRWKCPLCSWRYEERRWEFVSHQPKIGSWIHGRRIWVVVKNIYSRLVQDGRVEGRVLTPSCESTRITTNCWTIIDRKTLEHTKKDAPHPKTKEKLQWDGRRGTTTIKSNPITAGWVTHKLENNYTTHWSEGSESHVMLPNLWVWQREGEFPEKQTLKAGRIWLQDIDRTGGNRDSTPREHTQTSVHIRTQGEGSVTP